MLGGEVLEPEWLGNDKTHRVRCGAGHECAPMPSNVQQGQGICLICAQRSPATAWSNFRAAVASLGGEVLEPEWLGARTPHRVRCAAGHECAPRPDDIHRGQGTCRLCVGHDPVMAWANFKATVTLLGGEVLEPEWLGARTPHRVRCVAGHGCTPMPTNVQKGRGICFVCAERGFDPKSPGLVYLVTHPRLGAHKIGVGAVSGARVNQWRGRGWKVFQTLHFSVGADAYAVEQSVLDWLHKDLGLRPFLQPRDCEGWTETVDASAIDPSAIWARVEREAWT
jgi:hypothetical protein